MPKLEIAEEWLQLEKTIGMRPLIVGEDIPGIRAVIKAMARPGPGDSETLNISEEEVEPFKVRVYKSKQSSGKKLPFCIFSHGGGWCTGDLDSEEVLIRFIADTSKMVVVSVDYRLAPEHPWPASLDDVVAATQWAVKNFSDDSTVDTSKVVFAGTSAGGHLSLSASIKLIESGDLHVEATIALVPLIVDEHAVPAEYKDQYTSMLAEGPDANYPFLDHKIIRQFLDANGHEHNDPYFSVLLSPTLKKLNKTYVVNAGADILKSDGDILVDVLKEAGVPVHHEFYPGLPHVFWGVPSLEGTKRFYADLASYLGELVG